MGENTGKGCLTIFLVAALAATLFFGIRGEAKDRQKLKDLAEELDRANRYKVTDLYVVDNINGRKEVIVDTTAKTFEETFLRYYYDPNTGLFYDVNANSKEFKNELTHEGEITAELNMGALDPFGLYVKDNGQIYYTKEEVTAIEAQINENNLVRKIEQ